VNSVEVGAGRRRPDEPWTGGEIAQTVILQAVAVGLVMVGWYGASGSTTPRSQLSWVCLGLLGVVICGAANAITIASGRRSLRQRQHTALVTFDGALASLVPRGARAERDELRVASPASRLYHRPGCPLIVGRDGVVAIATAEHADGGRQPCGWCEP
jgi:hypothetical protein